MLADAQVGFEGEEDVEEVEVDQTPKRKVHGRQATAFAPKRAADVPGLSFQAIVVALCKFM